VPSVGGPAESDGAAAPQATRVLKRLAPEPPPIPLRIVHRRSTIELSANFFRENVKDPDRGADHWRIPLPHAFSCAADWEPILQPRQPGPNPVCARREADVQSPRS